MSEEPQRKPASRQLYAVVAGVFALFGFFESLTAIATYFQSDKAHVVAMIYPSRAMFPKYFYAAMGPGFDENGRTFLNTLNEYCDDQAPKSPPPVFSVTFQNADLKTHFCKHVKDMISASDQTKGAYVDSGTVLEMDVENRGSTKATGLRISTSGIEFINAFRDSNFIPPGYDQQNESYTLPDLNPGEEYRLEIWQDGLPYSHDGYSTFQTPDISFNGPPISVTKYTYVKESTYEVLDALSAFGPVFGTILFVIVCVVLGIGFILIIALIEALFKGKPLTSVFKTQANQENTSVADESPSNT